MSVAYVRNPPRPNRERCVAMRQLDGRDQAGDNCDTTTKIQTPAATLRCRVICNPSVGIESLERLRALSS